MIPYEIFYVISEHMKVKYIHLIISLSKNINLYFRRFLKEILKDRIVSYDYTDYNLNRFESFCKFCMNYKIRNVRISFFPKSDIEFGKYFKYIECLDLSMCKNASNKDLKYSENITCLKLFDTSTNITDSAFEHLKEQLIYLDISYNDHFSHGAFEYLEKLKYLNISISTAKCLDKNMKRAIDKIFDMLLELEILEIGGRKFKRK